MIAAVRAASRAEEGGGWGEIEIHRSTARLEFGWRIAASFAAVLLLTACGETSPYACAPLAGFAGGAGSEIPGIYENLRAAIQNAERPDAAAPFGRLVLGAGGRIWVQRERPPAFPGDRALAYGKAGALHDVFAPDGAYLGAVRIPEGEVLQAALGDTIWTFEVGELNETWVRARELRLAAAGGAS